MRLCDLIDCNYETEIKGIKINSKECVKGDLFVCTMGVNADRHDFVEDAINNGAVACIASKKIDVSVPVVYVDNTNEVMPKLMQKFYNNPHKEIKIIAVGGTDGKTSSATIIQTLIGEDLCGYIGTNGYSCSKFDKPTNNTTPDADKLYGYFREFLDSGCKYVAMETSSEAYFRHRLDDLEYVAGLITNITSEHLNIHKTFENYLSCKLQEFKQVKKEGFDILNYDDSHFEDCKKACISNIVTYGTNKKCTLYIREYKIFTDHTEINIVYDEKDYNINSPLLGDFNVYNLCGALLTCLVLGFDMEEMLKRVKNIKVSGRIDALNTEGLDFNVWVDYAHTPNGITNLLNFVHNLNINKSIVVIGQAGERDPYKRPVVGKCVVENSDYAIFCYEDPRSEDPMEICKDIIKDIKDDYSNFEIVIDRESAIKRAIDIAQKDDLVLILGKGNETYEKLKNETIYFNDEEVALKYIDERRKNK